MEVKMKVSFPELRGMLIKAFSAYADDETAQYLSDQALKTHLRKDSRINCLKSIIGDIEKYRNANKLEITLVSKKSSSKLYDLNGLPGFLFIKRINDELINAAENNGISMIGIKNSGGIHTLDAWTNGLAERGYFGFFTWNGGPYVTVPYGSKVAFWGTNPLSYAIPTGNKPILLDMATSEIAFMDLLSAKRNNLSLEDNQGLDGSGKVTNNPNQVFVEPDSARLVPIGYGGNGYKGSAILLLTEILTGALVGAKMGRQASNVFKAEEFGGLLVCIDIKSMVDYSMFTNDVSMMIDQIRDSDPADGFEKVLIPGDNAYARESSRTINDEVEIDDTLFEKLKLLIE